MTEELSHVPDGFLEHFEASALAQGQLRLADAQRLIAEIRRLRKSHVCGEPFIDVVKERDRLERELFSANVEIDNLRKQMADTRASCDQEIKTCDEKLKEVHIALKHGNDALETVIKQRNALKVQLDMVRGGRRGP